MSHDDFGFEPVPGLPAHLPQGEHILWQGRPDWRALAREALLIRWVAGYFALLALWRFGSVVDQIGVVGAIANATPYLFLGAIVLGLLALVAWLQARATLYTVTNRRVVMRIGAALTLTLNLPFTQLGRADLDLRRGGTGTIALATTGKTRLSYLVCWPHIRPWAMRQPQPALRCIPGAEAVARLLAEAAQTELSRPRVEWRPSPVAAE